MGLINGPETVRCILARDDYIGVPMRLRVDEYASDQITHKKNNKRDKNWLLPHQLLKRCYNIPGIPDGSKVLLITSRDVVWDPGKQLDSSWDIKTIRNRMGQTAREQQHKADANKNTGPQNVTMILLSISVAIVTLGVVIIGLLNYYRG